MGAWFISLAEKYQRRIPKVGDILPCFDDGKVRPSRLEVRKVVEVIPFEEGLKREFKMFDFKYEEYRDTTDEPIYGYYPLEIAWDEAVNDTYWLFNDSTDYFIVTETDCEYEPIEIFARTKDGFWFSFPLMNHMTGSELDTDMKLFNEWKDSENYSDVYWEIVEKFKIED